MSTQTSPSPTIALARPLQELLASGAPTYEMFLAAAVLVEGEALDLIRSSARLLDKGDSPGLVWTELGQARATTTTGLLAFKKIVDENLALPPIKRAQLTTEQWEELVTLIFQTEQFVMTTQRLCGQI